MYCLADDIARARRFYPRPLATLPDLLVIEIPARHRTASLPLGRYYPIVIETVAELREFTAWIRAPRARPVPPDLFDSRPSQVRVSGITLACYDPPDPGWPCALICHWPPDFIAASADPMMFARGAYTLELFTTGADRDAASRQLLDTLAGAAMLDLTVIAPQPAVAGSA